MGRDGVLDRYTRQSIAELEDGHLAFSGQRDDGFYADIQAVFDLLQLREPGKDSQKGFNVHTIVLNIPVDEIGGDRQEALERCDRLGSVDRVDGPGRPAQIAAVDQEFVEQRRLDHRQRHGCEPGR